MTENLIIEKLPEISTAQRAQMQEINRLKHKYNAVILSHYYMPPELQLLENKGGVADFVGDSLGLSIEGQRTHAERIIFCGVHFMAETAKVLDPRKKVYIPDTTAGCSLAASITPEDVQSLKRKYPGIPVMAYVNTSAEVKAACDICCTSRNAVKIAASLDSDTIIFIPDLYMGQNLQKRIFSETGKKLILWDGSCEVHEQFNQTSLSGLKLQYPDAEVLLHWEVPEPTVEQALDHRGGVLGSTTDILKYVGESRADSFILASECDLGATLKGMYPGKNFITPCIKCPYMKKITLDNTLQLLKDIDLGTAEDREVLLSDDILSRARLPIERMIALS